MNVIINLFFFFSYFFANACSFILLCMLNTHMNDSYFSSDYDQGRSDANCMNVFHWGWWWWWGGGGGENLIFSYIRRLSPSLGVIFFLF